MHVIYTARVEVVEFAAGQLTWRDYFVGADPLLAPLKLSVKVAVQFFRQVALLPQVHALLNPSPGEDFCPIMSKFSSVLDSVMVV
jgi:hypothetical protein